jgi:phosphatidylethanolamine-binding protein (PEBP) family uncharacterized protein
MAFSLSSPAFSNGQAIPAKYTCDGENLSPPLQWSGAPNETRGFALIVEDPEPKSPTSGAPPSRISWPKRNWSAPMQGDTGI